MIESFYINLKSREDRKELMTENWAKIVNLKRIDAIEYKEEKFGTKACYDSHVKAFNECKDSLELSLIMEDDIIPTSNFYNKLKDCIAELPDDWCILMVGFNVIPTSSFVEVTDKIAKATRNIMAGHCYMVNPKFKNEFKRQLENERYEKNLDVLLCNIQLVYPVYMCVPTLCYQYKSYSDNSKALQENTETTKLYFKE